MRTLTLLCFSSVRCPRVESPLTLAPRFLSEVTIAADFSFPCSHAATAICDRIDDFKCCSCFIATQQVSTALPTNKQMLFLILRNIQRSPLQNKVEAPRPHTLGSSWKICATELKSVKSDLTPVLQCYSVTVLQCHRVKSDLTPVCQLDPDPASGEIAVTGCIFSNLCICQSLYHAHSQRNLYKYNTFMNLSPH